MASSYWEHRAELRQLAYDRANNKVVADVSRVYDRTMRQLNDDIDSIIGTYQRKTGLTTREAYDFLNQGVPAGVMDELRSRVAVITDPRQRKKLQVMLSTDAYRARISRLDAIKGYTRVGLTEAAEAELQALTPHLKGMIESGYSRTLYDIQKVSYGFAGAGVPRSALDMILKSKWSGEHYSSRIWGNRDAMASILNRALMEQSTMGKLSDLTMQDVRGMVNLDKWRSQLTSKFKDEAQYAKYAANRLIRTESAYVANQATALAYEECEIERYEYISVLDSRTSKKCSGLDGQIFKVSEKEVGVNFPPAHAHCRSGVAPVLDTQNRKTMQRRAEGKDGKSVTVPRDMNYAEWKAWQDAGCPDVDEWRSGAKFDEFEKRLKTNYNASVSKDIRKLDFNSVDGSFGGLERVLSEFPETKSVFKGVDTFSDGIMGADFNGNVYYNPVYYNPANPTAAQKSINGHPPNTNVAGIGAHEGGHLVELALLRKEDPFNFGGYYSRVKWDNSEIANKVISSAANIAKATPDGKGKTIKDLVLGVSEYATKNRSECLAECVSDYVTNGKKAATLSQAVWEVLKEAFK